jgi:hypothetical protein
MANIVKYGFQTLKHLAGTRAMTVGVTEINRAIDEEAALYNAEMDRMIAIFADRTTEHTSRYHMLGAETLQPVRDDGKSVPTMPGAYYDVGYPIFGGATKIGKTRVAREKMTVAELERELRQKRSADTKWIRDHMLAALLVKDSRTVVDEEKGAITVQPLANGDAVTYLKANGSVATAQHYLAQTAGIADATDPYDDIRALLGAGADNGEPFVAFIPTGLQATTSALANFVELSDADIRGGSSADAVVGRAPDVPGQIIGKHKAGIWISLWDRLPANTILGLALDGPRPLAMREHMEESLQGFKRVADHEDHPWYDSTFERWAGFGAANRTGAVAYQVSGGDTTYDNPSGYVNFTQG